MIEIIHKLSSNGDLIKLYNEGVISYKVLLYRDIYEDFQIKMATTPFGREAIYHELSDVWKVSVRTVKRAVKFMENGDC